MVIRCLDMDSSFDAYCNGNKRLSGKKKSAQESRGKKIGRALIKDTIYFFLHPFGGGGEKHEDDNPMKYKGNGNKYI